VELYLHSPNTPSWRGAQLKHSDNFNFYSAFVEYDNIQSMVENVGFMQYVNYG